MTTYRARDLAALCQATIDDIQRVLDNLAQGLGRARNDMDDGNGSSSNEPKVGGSRDYTQRMLDELEKTDPVRHQAVMLVTAVEASAAMAGQARRAVLALLPMDPRKAKLMLGDGPATCMNRNCGRDVWCTPSDRLLAGRCEACYRYWDRHERMQERPEKLCHPERVNVDNETAMTPTSTASASEVTACGTDIGLVGEPCAT